MRDKFSLKTAKSLSLGGTIECNEGEVGGDVAVRGGIAGRETGSVTAGGQIIFRFCEATMPDEPGEPDAQQTESDEKQAELKARANTVPDKSPRAPEWFMAERQRAPIRQ